MPDCSQFVEENRVNPFILATKDEKVLRAQLQDCFDSASRPLHPLCVRFRARFETIAIKFDRIAMNRGTNCGLDSSNNDVFQVE